eukprot:140828-Rhodomonas_salina.2
MCHAEKSTAARQERRYNTYSVTNLEEFSATFRTLVLVELSSLRSVLDRHSGLLSSGTAWNF